MGFANAQAAVVGRAVPPGPRSTAFAWRLLRAPNGWLDVLTEYVLVANHQSFSKSMDYRALSRVLGQGLLTSEGEFWKRQRRLVQPAFFRDRILSYGGLMTSCTARMME